MSVNIGDTVATTLRLRIPALKDNVMNHNAFGFMLQKNGRINRRRDLGRIITEPFIYNNNSSIKWYSEWETFTPPTSDQEVIDASEWNWRMIGGFIAWNGYEERINRGAAKVHDFVEVRQKQLEANMQNTFATSLYSDGTNPSGKEIGGLQLIVSDTPSAAGTVGGIDQAANSFWQNYATTGLTLSSSTVKGHMNSAHINIIRGKDKPNLWLMDDDWFTSYEDSLQDQVRFTDTKMADAGFMAYKYKSANVMYDDQCPDKHCYAIDLDNINLRAADDRVFDRGDVRQISNADYKVVPVWGMMQMTTARRAAHGVMVAS